MANDCAKFSDGKATMNKMKPFMRQPLEISAILHSLVRMLLWCINSMSFHDSTAFYFAASHRDQPSGNHSGRCILWQLDNSSILRLHGNGQRRRGMQRLIQMTVIHKYSPEQEWPLKHRNTLSGPEISIRHQIVNTLELSAPPLNRGNPQPPTPPPPPQHTHKKK